MFEDLEVELLTGPQLGLWALGHHVEQSAPDWFNALTRTGGVESVVVTDDIDMTVAALDRSLPERSFIVALTRDERTWIPDDGEIVESGDQVTLLGRSDAIDEATAQLISLRDEGSIDYQMPEDSDD